MIESPQANIPQKRSLRDLMKGQRQSEGGQVQPPILIDPTQNPLTGGRYLNGKITEACGGNFIKRYLHNLGTNPLYYSINTKCVAGIEFHDVLAAGAVSYVAGVSADDGLGSGVDLSAFDGDLFLDGTAVRCSITVVRSVEHEMAKALPY